jgi:hypothetical protein
VLLELALVMGSLVLVDDVARSHPVQIGLDFIQHLAGLLGVFREACSFFIIVRILLREARLRIGCDVSVWRTRLTADLCCGMAVRAGILACDRLRINCEPANIRRFCRPGQLQSGPRNRFAGLRFRRIPLSGRRFRRSCSRFSLNSYGMWVGPSR